MTIDIVHPIEPPVLFPLYGDELLSVLAVALSAIAVGKSAISGVPDTDDVRLLLSGLAAMGVPVHRSGDTVVVKGVGRSGLCVPQEPISAGESGLVLRILTGLACGVQGQTVIEAQGQLARRTLVRMLEPLAGMGVHIAATYKHTPPLHVFGPERVQPLSMEFPLPNFYLKLPLVLAALFAEETSVISEPYPSVSHLEHLLTCADIRTDGGRHSVEIFPQDIEPFGSERVPMDAAVVDVLLAASALAGTPYSCDFAPVNTARSTLFAFLYQYSSSLSVERAGSWNNEAGSIQLSAPVELPSRIELRGTDSRRLKSALPAIAALCAGLPVELEVRDALDIRQNHCDWIAALVDGLTSFGADVEEFDDGFLLRGGQLQGAGVACYNDEAIALAMLAPAIVIGDATTLYEVPDTPRMRHCLNALGLEHAVS